MSLSDADMVEFRDAIADDADALAELLPNTALDLVDSGRFVVGVFHRRPICCARLTIAVNRPPGVGLTARIDHVAVEASMRGRGIEEVLVDHLTREATRRGADTVEVVTGVI